MTPMIFVGSGFSIVVSVPEKQMSTGTETTETWTVKVKPAAADTAVTVAINAGAVEDMNGNPLATVRQQPIRHMRQQHQR